MSGSEEKDKKDDYKVIFYKYEQNIYKEEVLDKVCEYLDNLKDKPEDERDHLIFHYLPRMTLRLLKTTFLNESLTTKAINFLKKTMKVMFIMMKQNVHPFIPVFNYIFDADVKFFMSRPEYMIEEDEKDDSTYAQAPRKLAIKKSTIYMEIVNYWGRLGGFESMLEQIEEDGCEISVISCYLSVLKDLKFSFHFKTDKFLYMIKRIWNNVLPRLRELSIDVLKHAKKEDIERIVLHLNKLAIQADFNEDQVNKITDDLSLSFSSKCLKTGTLEKRLHAISHISFLIRTVDLKDSSYHQSISKIHLLEWIKKNNVLGHIFGEFKHIQLVKNSSSIVKFLASNDELNNDSLELIWSCATTAHESLAKDTLSIISDISPNLRTHHLDFFLIKLKSIPIENYFVALTNFVSDLSQKASDHYENKIQFVDILWDIMTNTQLPWEIVNNAYSCLLYIINRPFFILYRKSYLTKLIKSIENSEYEVNAYFFCLIKSILETLSTDESARDHYITLYETMEDLQREYDFLNFLVKEFKRFKNLCQKKLSELSGYDINEYLSTYAFPHRHYYIDEIRNRLELLYLVIMRSGITIDQKQFVTDLWTTLYDKALCSSEQTECILWFSFAHFSPQEIYSALEFDVIPYLFESHISKIDPRLMNEHSFSCFQTYFLHANVFLNKMQWINQETQEIVVLQPGSLLGEQELWSIALTCSNEEVLSNAMELLNNCYENIQNTQENETLKKQLRSKFIHRCLEFMTNATTKLLSTNENQLNESDRAMYELRIERSLSIIEKLINKLESASSKHLTVTRGTPIAINVRLEYIKDENVRVHTFLYVTHSNEIVNSVYEGILKVCEEHLASVGLKLEQISHDSNYDLEDISRTLKQLNIHSHYELTLKRKSSISHRETRLCERKSLKVRAEPPMNADELIQKVMEVSGLNNSYSEYALKKWGWDMDRVFGEVLDDSRRERFLNECKDEIKIQSYSKDNDLITIMNERNLMLHSTTYHDSIDPSLPSSILSELNNLNSLFSILQVNQASVVNNAWNIILRVSIPKSIKESIIFMPSNPDWNILLPDDKFRLLYHLKIIDQILFPLNPELNKEVINKWTNWFVTTEGLNRLIQVLLSNENNISSELANSNTHNYFLELLTLSMKIINYYLNGRKDSDILKDSILSKESILSQLKDFSLTLLRLGENEDLIHYSWRILFNIAYQNRGKDVSTFKIIPELEKLMIGLLLFNQNEAIRIETSRLLFDLLQNTGSESLKDTLVILQNYLPPDQQEDSSNYEQYYWLLQRVIACILQDQVIDLDSLESNINNLIMKIATTILSRDIFEYSNKSIPDWILCGSLRTLSTICHFWYKSTLDSEFVELLYGCLFLVGKEGKSSHPKCKTNETRKACYDLLIALCMRSMDNFETLLSLLSNHHSPTYQKMYTWNYDPSDDDKSSSGYVGITNLGATCYMSSLLQQFYMIPKFKQDILKCNLSVNEQGSTENIITQLQKMFGYLQESEKLSYNPKEFCNSYRDIEGNPIQVNQQQDVNEFFNVLCLRIENELKSSADEKLLHKHFVGMLSNEIRSEDPNYQYTSEREEEFYTIPLDVGNRNNFESALDLFIKSDVLDGDNKYYCEEFDTKIKASRRCVIKKLPKTLIFHLMRFDYDLASNRKKKLNNYFHFPTYVNMKPWTKEGIMEERGETIDEKDRLNDSFEYELCGILVHAGDADSGHYYSFIKEREPPYRWLQFNDRIVTEFNPEHIGAECFGGTYETTVYDPILDRKVTKEVTNDRNAYMLFYERIDKNETKETPVSNNGIELINNVPKYVYDSVWAENSAFLRDRQLFDSLYFNFVLKFTKLLNFQKVDILSEMNDDILKDDFSNGDITLCTIKFATRVAIEMVSHAKCHDQFSWWAAHLTACFKKNIPACVWFIEYLKRNNIIKNLLLSCPHERMRTEVSDLILTIFKTVIECKVSYISQARKSNKEEEAQHILIQNVLDLLEESRGSWKRFKQYFEVIQNYALLGKPQRKFLLDYGLLDLYKDYYMGANKGKVERVPVMDEQYFPDLVEFCNTISILIRGCTNESKGDILPPNRISDDLIEMENGWLDFFCESRFLRSYLEMDYNTPASCEILTYIAFNCPKRSDHIMEILVNELDECQAKRSRIFEQMFTAMILMDDGEANVQHRIRNYISSFKYQANKDSRGSLLRIAKYARNTKRIIPYVLRLASQSEALSRFLSSSRDIHYIIDTYESILEDEYNDFFLNESIIQEDLKKGYHMCFLGRDISHEEQENWPKWRRSEYYFGLLYAYSLVTQKPSGSNRHIIEDHYRQINELKKELETYKKQLSNVESEFDHLKQQNMKLREIVSYFKEFDNSGVKEILSKVDSEQKSEGIIAKTQEEQNEDKKCYVVDDDDDDDDDDEDDDDKIDINDKVRSLKEFFDHLEDEVLIEALHDNNYDINSAANDLFDEDKVNYYRLKCNK